MTRFHIYLYGPATSFSPTEDAAGLPNLPSGAPTTPLPTSFEDAAERLVAVIGASFEPDGSFACVTSAGHERIFGMLYDAAERVQYVELQGEASRAFCRRVVQVIGGDAAIGAELMVMQLPERDLKSFQAFEAAVWPGEAESDGG